MKNSGKNISAKRASLILKENKLLSKIDQQSIHFEKKVGSNLKRIAVIGGGFLIGFIAYKLITNDKKEKKSNRKNAKNLHQSSQNPLVKTIISNAIKTIIPYAIERISTTHKAVNQNDTGSTNS